MSTYTPSTWADALLGLLGAPTTQSNRDAIVAWEAAEGGNWHNTARFNPLDTTQTEPGATSMNSVGVKAYSSWDQGLAATVQTLRSPAYAGVLSALHKGNDPQGVVDAVTSSPWGTHSISLAGKTYTGSSSSGGKGFGYYLTHPWDAPGAILEKAAGAAGSAAGSATAAVWSDAKPFLVRMGFVTLGLGLIAIGVVKATAPARKTVTEDAGGAAKDAAAVGAVAA